jgi:hypothetical protein
MPRPRPRLRTAALVLGLVVVVAGVVVVTRVVPAQASDDAAREVVRRYATLVSTGDEEDLQDLWSMWVTESPGALRTAGELLAGAEQRVEVVSVGEARPGVPDGVELDVPYEVELDDMVSVLVRLRLDGADPEEWDEWVVVGRLDGTSGRDVGDWRVVEGGLSALVWPQGAFGDVEVDAYVSDVRQVRRPRTLGGSDEDVQPLYPAVYPVQRRLDPWFASAVGSARVPSWGSSLPALALEPTGRTVDRITRDVWARFALCGNLLDRFECPAADLGERAGADVYESWWRGLVRRPEVEVGDGLVTLTGGRMRVLTSDGPQTIDFDGTGRYALDNQSWTPVIISLDLVEAP